MKNVLSLLLLVVLLASCQPSQQQGEKLPAPEDFVRISGHDLIKPDGSKLFIRGTNLGNWLNPEGYMFGFNKANSGANTIRLPFHFNKKDNQ